MPHSCVGRRQAGQRDEGVGVEASPEHRVHEKKIERSSGRKGVDAEPDTRAWRLSANLQRVRPDRSVRSGRRSRRDQWRSMSIRTTSTAYSGTPPARSRIVAEGPDRADPGPGRRAALDIAGFGQPLEMDGREAACCSAPPGRVGGRGARGGASVRTHDGVAPPTRSHEMVDEVEQAVIGPLQVLEDQHAAGVQSATCSKKRTPRGKELLALEW